MIVPHYHTRTRSSFESLDSEVTTLAQARALHFRRGSYNYIGTTLGPNFSYCYIKYYAGGVYPFATWPRDNAARIKCLQERENGIQKPISGTGGYFLKAVPRITIKSIVDMEGDEEDFMVHVWKPIYGRKRSRKCARMARMGDPRLDIECPKTVIGRKLYHYRRKRRYRVPKGTCDMKPVLSILRERWVEGSGVEPGPNSAKPLDEISNVSIADDSQLQSSDIFSSPIYPVTSFKHQWPGGDPMSTTTLLHPIDLVDVYGTIAQGLPEIGGFTMSTETNLLVNLIQIKELLSLFSRRPLLLGPVGLVASLFLMTEFAIKPTVDDYITMRDMAQKLIKAVDAWNKNAGKTTYFHFIVEKGKFEESETLIPIVGWEDSHQVSGTTKTVVTIAIKGTRITVPNSAIMLSQLGVTKPIGVLWELIPFSFVLDWFTDLSGFISQFEDPVSPAHFTFVNACYSSKEKRVHTVKNEKSSSYLTFPKIHDEITIYDRRLLNMDILRSPSFIDDFGGWEPSNRFGPKQGLLALALAAVLYPSLRR